MAEMLTIFDEHERPIGIKERERVHKDGDWHETFHCWMFHKEAETTHVLLQQRADHKKDFPSLLDITAAGHIEAGEDVLWAGVREIEEEVGLTVVPDDLIHQGDYKEELKEGASLIDREICRIYLLPWTKDMVFKIGEEVKDIISVSLADMESLTDKQQIVKGVSILSGDEKVVTHKNLVPHEKGYERYIFQAIREYVAKL
ncbi:NUDIX domain-containing protein [Halobacillus litoralis]|uniref:NUDIX hydrolase n=1 Tax=Halobacillus litoralis TaxID=45668 RepID=UPI001CFE0D2D|nr:NUDIX domain-containing protein [Halobacillus litoralis]WLR48251.1 NUDIX domain-containing protein [Halobacillus litoralis]